MHRPDGRVFNLTLRQGNGRQRERRHLRRLRWGGLRGPADGEQRQSDLAVGVEVEQPIHCAVDEPADDPRREA